MNSNTATLPSSAYKIVFFGSLSVMSYAVLNYFLRRKLSIANVVIPGIKPGETQEHKLANIPIISAPEHYTIELLALEHNIPITYVNNLEDMETYSAISKYEPHFIFVACFPYILPEKIWRMPKVASLNLHPSLLPKYRGPDPIFWQLHRGEVRTGVTIHKVNNLVDGGDIILQKDLRYKNGLRDRAIKSLLGEQGAKLFIEALRLYVRECVEAKPQDPAAASYMGQAKTSDFELHINWSAQHAFNFMRGTEDWNMPYTVQIGGKNLLLESAIAYSPAGKMEEDYRIDGNIVFIRFAQGLLQAYSTNPLID